MKSREGRMAVASSKRWRVARLPARWRITELAHAAGTAVSAVMVCSPMLLAARPKTPLRVFCIAAFEYLARLRGGTLGRTRRLAIAHACDFGSLRDDYYDHRKLDSTEYRSLRRTLRRLAPETATSRYFKNCGKQSGTGRSWRQAALRPVISLASLHEQQLRFFRDAGGNEESHGSAAGAEYSATP